uniref:Glycosyltransferase n=1 Tax=Syphacia muris TaxID=451379 RepID=A0A0N5AJN6_9BILA
MALDSIRCYVASTDYELAIVDVYNDTAVNERCSNNSSIYFRKHCAASIYLEKTDWLLVLDADSTVVNPNHCIEEYIDPNVNIIFYERFFNWEIAAGNYLAKNSAFTKNFLLKWASYEHYRGEVFWWKGFDNGALHMVVIESVLPNDSQEIKNCRNIWHRSRNYETYVPFVICVRFYLGASRLWPGKIKILRRGHGFCRDWYITNGLWTPKDFMLHGWKVQHVLKNSSYFAFTKDINVTLCGQNLDGWPWKKESMVNTSNVKHLIAVAEKNYSNRLPKQNIVIPFLDQPDVANCYPNCDTVDKI